MAGDAAAGSDRGGELAAPAAAARGSTAAVLLGACADALDVVVVGGVAASGSAPDVEAQAPSNKQQPTRRMRQASPKA